MLKPLEQPAKLGEIEEAGNNIRKVSPLHASRMQSRKIVQDSRDTYKKDEAELKEMRLSLENIKVSTIQRFENMNMKSPK